LLPLCGFSFSNNFWSMVNENTRMYIPEENHQGKAGRRHLPRL
jgi:hypothetical protein